jgi:hypothetical protein
LRCVPVQIRPLRHSGAATIWVHEPTAKSPRQSEAVHSGPEMQIGPKCRTCHVTIEVALDGNRKALTGITLRAFDSAHVITRCGRFDLGQPHGVAALGARKDSDFSTAVDWIWMGGWHDARLRLGGSVILSVTGNCRQGAVMESTYSPCSRAAGQYCSLFQIVRRRTVPTRGGTLRPPIERRVTARDPQWSRTYSAH